MVTKSELIKAARELERNVTRYGVWRTDNQNDMRSYRMLLDDTEELEEDVVKFLDVLWSFLEPAKEASEPQPLSSAERTIKYEPDRDSGKRLKAELDKPAPIPPKMGAALPYPSMCRSKFDLNGTWMLADSRKNDRREFGNIGEYI